MPGRRAGSPVTVYVCENTMLRTQNRTAKGSTFNEDATLCLSEYIIYLCLYTSTIPFFRLKTLFLLFFYKISISLLLFSRITFSSFFSGWSCCTDQHSARILQPPLHEVAPPNPRLYSPTLVRSPRLQPRHRRMIRRRNTRHRPATARQPVQE